MLKFVSTKPPRGRSPFRSITPDRENVNRMSSLSESSSRMYASPMSSRKHYSSSQSKTFPNTRSAHGKAVLPPGYHPVSRSFTIASSRDLPGFGESSSDFQSLNYLDKPHHHHQAPKLQHRHSFKEEHQRQTQRHSDVTQRPPLYEQPPRRYQSNQEMAFVHNEPKSTDNFSNYSRNDDSVNNYSYNNFGVNNFINKDLGAINFSNKDLGVNNFSNKDLGVNNFSNKDLGVNNFSNKDLGVNKYSTTDLGVNNFSNKDLGVNKYSTTDLGVNSFGKKELGVINSNYNPPGVHNFPSPTDRTRHHSDDYDISSRSTKADFYKPLVDFCRKPQPPIPFPQDAILSSRLPKKEPSIPYSLSDSKVSSLTDPETKSGVAGERRPREITSLIDDGDYDLAKAIPNFEDHNKGIIQSGGPKTTQYIVRETLTKNKTSETYIPPTRQEDITKQFPASSTLTQQQLEDLSTYHSSQVGYERADRLPAVQWGQPQVMTTCVSHASSNQNNETMNKANSSKKSLGISSQSIGSSSTVRDMLNRSQEKSVQEGAYTFDVVHITDRIISMTFPSDTHETIYSVNLKEAIHLLKAKHGDNFLILNVSEKHPELTKVYPQVKEFGWPDHLSPPLERLCSICKAVDSWLSTDSRHMVVLHCKGGLSRLASIIAAYMHYNNICASADQAVDSRAMKRYYDEKLGGLSLPSQQRYVGYFSGLLSGIIKINSNPWYLHHILIHGVPNFDTNGGCCPFIKIYQSMQPIFTSGVYDVTDNMKKVCISITPGIPLRGDILMKCYHKKKLSGQKEIIWQCQFHTCAITGSSLVFSKFELDDAATDPRFPDTGKVEFVFGPTSDVLVSVAGFKSDITVPVVDNQESLVRAGSYEDFNKTSDLRHSGQTSGNYNSNFSSGSIINNQQYTSQNNSTINRGTDKNSAEHIQLDELLSNLLSDQVHVSSSQDHQAQSKQPFHPSDTNSGIPVMNSAKTITTTTRTFTSYTSTDAHPNPDKVLVQRQEISYKVPSQNQYSHSTNSVDMLDTGHTNQSYHSKGNNAFSYTPGSSSAQRTEFVEQDLVRNPEYGQQTSQLSYYPKFDPKMNTSLSPHNYSSLDGETNSWLAQQQQKLKNFKEGREVGGRSEQERDMMNELQFSQNKNYTHQTDKSQIDGYNKHNTSTSERISSSHGPQRSHSTTAVDRHYQDQFYNSSYNTSFVETNTYSDRQSNRPPPSPSMQRSHPSVPVRSSSKEYMRSLSNSNSWQQQRPLQRQNSETLYDRTRDAEPMIPRAYGSRHNTPPHSPARASSPSVPNSTTTYTSYRTVEKQQETADDVHRSKVVQQQQYVQQPQQPVIDVNHHYVTEVFVHRSDLNKDNAHSIPGLQDQPIKSSQQQQQQQYNLQQIPQQQVYESRSSSQQYNTYTETVSKGESMSVQRINQTRSQSPPLWDNVDGPEPVRVKEIEVDQIILRPIGPGMQTLEPETAHTGTLGRPTIPGFPNGPSGGQVIVSGGNLQPLSGQQQTIQHQQYHQNQQYQSQTFHHGGQEQGTLHIDTSPRIFASQHSPSAGSPSSPDNINTYTQQMSASTGNLGQQLVRGQSSPSVYIGLSRRESLSSLTDTDMVHATPKFVKDTSKYWYKPNISREEAIQLLKDKQPGAFVIRDSNSFPGAYGLALKVATLPANVQAKSSGDPQADLVRHFLIEPTPKGVRLRGCSNEPVFGSLAALVYQHSVTPLALPWKLSLPEPDAVNDPHFSEFSVNTSDVNSASTLLSHGAACNVIYINSVDLESLTGPQAIAKAVKTTFENLAAGRTTVVHFKVFNDGITLTDNNRKLFFRRHYPVAAVTYCGMDPQDRRWKRELDAPGGQGDARLFGFVARKQGSTNENTCHIFAELDPEQPASAIVNFVTKVMIGQSKLKS